MNVRRMVMVMLVLGCLVQGVSATTDSVTDYNTWLNSDYGYGDNSYYSYTIMYNSTYTTGTFYYIRGKSIYGASTIFTLNVPAGSTGEYFSQSGQFDIAGVYWSLIPGCGPSTASCSYNYPELVQWTASSDPPTNVSGESCTGEGVFRLYSDATFLDIDSDGGNYSFTIFNGTDYQIHYTDVGDEWHNFTATASDHTWNPTCTLPSISGTITALDGEGIYNLNVTLHDFYLYERDLVDSTFTDTNGSYNFDINDSADAGPYALSASGYCNAGADCSTFRIEAPINPGGESYVFDYTWHIPQNIRVDLQYENGSAVQGALLNMNNLPGDVGAWKTTATDGYTTYTSMQSSKIYVDYHGGDLAGAGSDVLHSFQLTPNGQYRRSQFTVTIPDDFTNNTTIPVIPPPIVDDANKTDITDMVGDSVFLVTVRDSETSAPLKDVTVTAVAADKLNYTGQWTGYTNTSGQWSFSKNYTVGEYDVSVQLKCYLPQTTTRRASATFDLVYSCGELPGTDDNGTGGWQDNDSYSNWTFNNSMETENDVKNKLNSFLYIVAVITGFVLFATYFVKK